MKNKVKLFAHYESESLEDEINEFLEKNGINDWKISYDLSYGGTCVIFSALLTYDDSVDWSPWNEEQVAIFSHTEPEKLEEQINEFLDRKHPKKWKAQYGTAYMDTCIVYSVLIRYRKRG